ncbi:MAG: type II toxin-antitoxin system ParD family antitoxin [Phyllobacteriaceae bacterium]|nr:type II toxin-antitoxin system ParD family antitoxin [Phyllobacteriaceae bacterium]
MAMSADLGKPLEEFVEALVKTGRYRSRSEVLREGVRLVQEREVRNKALDALLAPALADIESGRIYPMEQVFDSLLEEIEQMAAFRDAS